MKRKSKEGGNTEPLNGNEGVGVTDRKIKTQKVCEVEYLMRN